MGDVNTKKCLVTASLIGSINWCMKAPSSIIKPEKGGDGVMTWKQKAYDDLYNTVNRVKTPFPEVAQRGVDFEKAVYAKANKDIIGGSELFREVCEEVKGFKFYHKGGIEKKIGENTCYLYCKYDAFRPNFLIDLKTTTSYKKGKYLGGFQHKLYCYVTGINLFRYVAVEWEKYPNIKKVHRENYVVESKEDLEQEVIHTIEDSFELLKDLKLWGAYRDTYCMY